VKTVIRKRHKAEGLTEEALISPARIRQNAISTAPRITRGGQALPVTIPVRHAWCRLSSHSNHRRRRATALLWQGGGHAKFIQPVTTDQSLNIFWLLLFPQQKARSLAGLCLLIRVVLLSVFMHLRTRTMQPSLDLKALSGGIRLPPVPHTNVGCALPVLLTNFITAPGFA